MYLTNEKKLNFGINGLFYTRKWNDYVKYVYFENVFGGKSLLRNINKKSEELGLIFNSSMINESEEKKWLESGWFKKHSLLVCESRLKNIQRESLKPHKSINYKTLVASDIPELIKLDGRIFEPYWKNSHSNFIETMKSCNKNYLFKISSNTKLCGYAILGVTSGFSYLQRFGIEKGLQKQGLGKELLEFILLFAKLKNYKKMKLNTQENNEAALSLYTKNSFRVSKRKLIIMSSRHQNEV